MESRDHDVIGVFAYAIKFLVDLDNRKNQKVGCSPHRRITKQTPMQITLDIPEAVEAGAVLKAGRTGRTPHRVLTDAFYKFMPVITDGAMAYQDIAALEGCCVLTVGNLARSGAFGKLIRKNRRVVRVPIAGYLKWKEGRAK